METLLDQQFKGFQTKYDLFQIGHTSEQEPVSLSEEDRGAHMLCIGSTGEGKSKFIEFLIRHDIDNLVKDKNAPGLCFLDYSASGAGINSILKYCAKRGFENVYLIDPHLKKVPPHYVTPINPFAHRVEGNQVTYLESYRDESVDNIEAAIRNTFATKDPNQTAYITRFLPIVLRTLWAAKLTLHETLYFTNKDYWRQRDFMYGSPKMRGEDITALDEVYKNAKMYEHFQSTINRLSTIADSTLDLMLSARAGWNFQRLVSRGCVLLVNLRPGSGMKPIATKFLASLILSEIETAIKRIQDAQPKYQKPYYIYLDEAGLFATQAVADIVDFKRQLNLRFVLSTQYPGQFKDPEIQTSVRVNTKIKAAFYIDDADERQKTVKMMGYGGALSEREVSFTLSQQRKQEAVMRWGKELPHRVKVMDVPDTGVSEKVLESFKNKIIRPEIYRTEEQIRKAQHERFKHIQPEARADSGSPKRRTKAHSPANKPTVKRSALSDE